MENNKSDRAKIEDSLLIRYLKNDFTDQERADIEALISASDDDSKMVRDYFYLSWATAISKRTKNNTANEALKKINKRLRKQRWHTYRIKFQQAAAVLFIPLLLLAGYWYVSLKQTRPMAYMELRTAPGMTGSIYLPDSTKVWLNSATYIKYPICFDGPTREVVIDGEAYFDVRQDKEKKFIVHAGESSVLVLGTQFNIDAYSHHNHITTTLVEGSLAFRCIGVNAIEEMIYIKPNEQIIYDKETCLVEQNETEVLKDIAWIKGQIIFRDTPFKEILQILSKTFDVEFVVRNSTLYKHSFTATFTDHHIERILDYFKRSSGISYKMAGYPGEEENTLTKRIELY